MHKKKWNVFNDFTVTAVIKQLLWLLIPLYLGYAIWQLMLSMPVVRYQPEAESLVAVDIDKIINETEWYKEVVKSAAKTTTITKPSLAENIKITLQGVFMRELAPSIAIIAHSGTTEVAVQNKPTQHGYTLRKARPFEIELEDKNGKVSLVKMRKQIEFNDLYQKKQTNTLKNDVFVPSESLSLKPIQGRKVIGNNTIAPMRPLSQQNLSYPRHEYGNSSIGSNVSPTVITGNNLPNNLLLYLLRNKRYSKLSLDKQEQLRNLMANTEFAVAVKNDPSVLRKLINSFPIELQ